MGNSFQAFKHIVAKEGLRGLYRAYWIHQMTWAPFNGIYFLTYEKSKKYFSDHKIIPKGFLNDVASSCVAGTTASILTSPLDLVKTRLQVQNSNPALFDYAGPLDALIKIVKNEGPKALFDGVAARIIWLTPRISIAVSMYEYIKSNVIS